MSPRLRDIQQFHAICAPRWGTRLHFLRIQQALNAGAVTISTPRRSALFLFASCHDNSIYCNYNNSACDTSTAQTGYFCGGGAALTALCCLSLCLSSGVDSMSNYEQVIRHVRYYNWLPGQLTERRFRLTCSELNGRYTSNEFNLEVSASCCCCGLLKLTNMLTRQYRLISRHVEGIVWDFWPHS